MKKLSILLLVFFISFSTKAQTAEELKKELASKKDSISKLQPKAKAIEGKINALPGWRKGAFGTIGASLSGFNNWYARAAPNTSAGNIGITVNGYANLIEDKFVKKQMKTKGILSYLYYQDGEVLINEFSPKERLGEFLNNETKFYSMSMGK